MGLSLGMVAALGYETIFLLVAIVIGIIILCGIIHFCTNWTVDFGHFGWS